MKNNKGFTLIEVVISFCILAIIFSAVLTAVLSFSHQLVQSNELKRNVDSTFSEVQKETEATKSNKKMSFRVGDKNYEQEIQIYKKSIIKPDVLMQRFEAFVNYEPTTDENVDTESGDTVSLHKIDINFVTFTVYDRIQFIDCVRDDGTKLDQGTYVRGNRYRVGDYVTYNNKIYLKVAKSGDWIVTVTSGFLTGYKISEKQVNDTLSPGNALSGWQVMYPGYDPNSSYLKGDLVVNHTASWFESLLNFVNERTFNLKIISDFAYQFGSADIYCCDLKYDGSNVDAVGYSGSVSPYEAKGYSWTKVGNYSHANSTKQQYRDWLTKNLKNSEIYG
ncbi:prepilin-type N-terminal cleavage/methylation domain-containing protein [Kandleria vitulina]|uniref:type II secretion system protein n=1 Tax=Kandleria vitulina TaxID=1630 RepID=UPI00088BD336|nr:prepilin-type N-terminal cleavage/methylation domain-containing protein [Kandleria vitulina]SDL55338.1 prepilin-type N-terminal cleavage/methylation domain-containing protein [Kandleria vitulina]